MAIWHGAGSHGGHLPWVDWEQCVEDTSSVSEHEELDQAPYVISVELIDLAEPRVVGKPCALRKPKHAVHVSDRNKYTSRCFPGSGLTISA